MTSADDRKTLSPELVLVDPELAAWARERLGERSDSPIPAGPAVARPVATRRAAARELGAKGDQAAVAPTPALPTRRRRRLVVAATMGLAVVAAAVLVVDRDAPGVRVPVGSSSSASDGRAPTSPTAPNTEAGSAAPRAGRDTSRPPAPRTSARAKGLARAKAPAIATPPRRFVWAPRPGASGYNVELFKGRTLVFRAATSKPEIVIPRRWRLNGRPRRLEPGSYRWYVWPRIAGRRESTATVQASFVVPTR